MKRRKLRDSFKGPFCYRPHFERLEDRLLLASDSEPNNTAALANPFVANESIDGTVGSLTDIDYFKISLDHGSRLRLFEINYVMARLPPSIEVLDDSGNVLAASAVGDELEMTANLPGVYFVRITSKSDFGDIADNYLFKTSVVNFSGITEQEPNNTQSSANAVGLNRAVRGQLSSSDASDFYSFNLETGYSLFVNFNGLPDQRPGVRLLDSSGVVVDSGLAGQGIAFNATKSGTYVLEVMDNTALGITQYYVGAFQLSLKADTPGDSGEDLDQSSPWVLGRGNSVARGELSTLNDVDTFSINLNSLEKALIALYELSPGRESIPTYGRSMIAYDRQGSVVAKSKGGVLNIERFLGSTPGEYLIQVFADSSLGLGKYGLRAWNYEDFSKQRDVALHFIDFTRQLSEYQGINFTAPFAATEAIPFVTGFLQSRFGTYDIDVTLNKPDIPFDRYIRSGFGDFQGLSGGAGGGNYGTRRTSGSSANNADETSWTLNKQSAALIHEFGHAAGLGHARDISSEMSYVRSDSLLPPGSRFGFVDVDQRRPDLGIKNDRNRLDWSFNSGSQVLERESDLNSPQEIDSNFREMTYELNESPLSLATQQTPSHLVSGDLNGDGWKDIVVTHSGTTLIVYMSDARGGFLSPRNYTVNTIAWWNESATVADFNRDGRDDVAVISRDQETLTVLVAGADGTLVAGPNQSIGRRPQLIQSVDMNGDGIVDLVAANASNHVSIMRGIGNGTFLPPQSFSSGLDPNHLILQDFNGDNRVDIATSNYGSDTISIMLADSSGGYNTVSTLAAGATARGLTSGDYDGDGDLDIAVANHFLRKVAIYSNRGNGLFDAANSYDLGIHYPENLTTADMNQDGKPDIIASGNTSSIEVLLGMGNGTFLRGVSFSTPNGAVNSIALDVNKDGLLDIASISFWQNQLYVQTGKADSLRNDRVVAYGEISASQDLDVYSLGVTAGVEYSFDIDSAEFQYPLDSELKILSSTGSVLVSNRQAIDRESGIDSVDPYIVTTFGTSETIRIVVSSERGTTGGYRLKVTPATALKKDGPHVLAVVPDNRVVIDTTRQISFLMDKPIDPSSVRSDSIVVRGAQNGIRTGSAFVDPLDGFIVWTADSTLPIDTYTVTLVSGPSGIRDLFGNALDGEIPVDFKFPKTSGNGITGGNFVTSFTVDRMDSTPPFLYFASYERDPSNRGRFMFRWSDELSFKSIESAQFTLRGAGPDGQFNTADDRVQSMDAIYNKIGNLSPGQGSIDLYSRGYPDSDLYRIESTLLDAAGNTVPIVEQINVGSTVPESSLFVDANRTRNGLTGSYVNKSLRSTTSPADWRTTQSIAGTRVDNEIAFYTDSLGKRSEVNVTGGTDANWDDFSVQWDGWITIPKDGVRLQTRSDEGSRLWVDSNMNGQFDPTELFNNNWGRGQGTTDGALTSSLSAGTYPIRVQYEEGSGGNRILLEWISADSVSIEKGHVNGPSVIAMNIQPGSAYLGPETRKLDIDFSGALDTSTLTSSNFRLRFSNNPDFYDGNDTFVSDADGVIQWDPTLRRATFEAATALNAGYYLVELNGRTGGIRNSAGKLLDGEFLSNFIAGNTNILSPSRHVSGNGLPGGDYRGGFSIVESISLSIPSGVISENGGSTTGTVSRNSSTASALVINLSSSDTTAATVPNSVTIPIGATTASFTVRGVDDALADGNQVSVITASATGYSDVPSNVTVVDDEVATLQLNLSRNSISENAGTTTATVFRNTPTNNAMVVALNSSNTLAAIVPASLTIPVGASSASFTVSAVDDFLADGDQLSTIAASAINFISGSAQLTVVDDETATFAINLSNNSISENRGSTTATVTRNTPTNTSQIVSLVSSDITAATVPSTIIIPVGASSATFLVSGVDDSIADGFQSSIITASAANFQAGSVQVNVIDDEVATLRVSLISGQLQENSGSTTATVTRNTPTNVALIVNVASSLPGVLSVPNSVTIPVGESTALFAVTVIDDAIANGNRQATVSASATNFVTGTATVVIVDNESPSLSLTVSAASISENGGTSTVTVARNTSTAQALVVTLRSSDNTAATVPISVTIPAGANSITFIATATNDSIADGNQQVTITASATGFSNGTVPIVVVDDETPTLSVSLSPSSVSEKKGKSIATVTRNTPTTSSLTVNLSSSDPSAATVPSSVVIPVGASSVTFDATAVDDIIVDGSQVAIISATASSFVSEVAQLTVTDDDIASLSLRIAATSISEKNGTTTAVVTRNTSLDLAMLIDLVSSDPLTLLVPKNVTIPIGAESTTFELTAVDDEIADGNQRVAITATANGMLSGASDLNIIDDEFASLSLSVDRSSIAERDGQATATVTRNTPMNNALDVIIAAVDASKVQFPVKVTIPAGQASVSFGVSSNDNPIVDGDLEVKLTATLLGFATGQATLLILDDDIPRLQIAISNAAISEKDGATTGIVTRNTPTANTMTVQLTNTRNSSIDIPASVVIPAGAASVSFTIRAINDAIADGDDILSLTASANGLQSSSETISIVEDDVPTLMVTLAANAITESNGTTTAKVVRNTPTADALVVTLASSDTSEAVVPETVVIPAGASEASFTITAIADNVVDGPQKVQIAASFFNFVAGMAEITILDANLWTWTNPRNPLDTDDDNWVGALDVLSLVNDLNSNGSRRLTPPLARPQVFLDPDRDGLISPLDVLMIVNYLNQRSGGEGEGSTAPLGAGSANARMALDIDQYFSSLDANEFMVARRRRPMNSRS